MRMWNIDPSKLCDKHLLGEHVEMHMFVGSIKKGTSLKGYINKGLVEVHNIKKRHNDLDNEMNKRGMKHKSSLPDFNDWIEGKVLSKTNHLSLCNRCINCKNRR